MEEGQEEIELIGPPARPYWVNFLIAGTSGIMATCVVHPVDLLKTRMQLISTVGPSCPRVSFSKIVKHVIHCESSSALYQGLSAAVLRQFVYSSGRLSGFNFAYDYYRCKNEDPPDFKSKMVMGCTAGCVGAFVSCPAEICLIRMMADGRLPRAQRRNYKNVLHAILRITREEGFITLWRGSCSTILRATVVTGAQLATYTQVKERLLPDMGDNVKLHITASMIAGLVATVASLPIDIVKTRVQDSPKWISQWTTFRLVMLCEGYFALWRGFLPTFLRIGPHTVITFVILEQINKAYRKYYE